MGQTPVKGLKAKETRTKEEINKLQIRRTHIVKEILETERTYVGALRELTDVWEKPMRVGDKGKPVIPENEIDDIFIISSEIKDIHEKMLEQLQERIDKWDSNQQLSDIFIHNYAALTLYTEYVNKYDNSMYTIEKNTKKKNFIKFMSERTDKPPLVVLPALLIQPIQRIPRYRLLLEDLMKHTWITHPDYGSLQMAVDHIKSLSSFIDEQKGKYESLLRLFEIQEEIGKKYDILTLNQEILVEGTVELSGKTCQYCLMNNSLLIWQKPSGLFGSNVHLLAGYSEVAYKKEEDKINLIYKDKLLNLLPSNADEWFSQFEKARSNAVKQNLTRHHSQFTQSQKSPRAEKLDQSEKSEKSEISKKLSSSSGEKKEKVEKMEKQEKSEKEKQEKLEKEKLEKEKKEKIEKEKKEKMEKEKQEKEKKEKEKEKPEKEKKEKEKPEKKEKEKKEKDKEKPEKKEKEKPEKKEKEKEKERALEIKERELMEKERVLKEYEREKKEAEKKEKDNFEKEKRELEKKAKELDKKEKEQIEKEKKEIEKKSKELDKKEKEHMEKERELEKKEKLLQEKTPKQERKGKEEKTPLIVPPEKTTSCFCC